ncbi:hypothetical protein EG68_11261 [Paragonimus skrjabini miyazakii]|uniref:Uncharacterized protein n=1 Tax=Paragonimus skrjabini miyazakii TaxID=59628 RepID=A0A8S9YEL0_9TREM|nr:hypothetical protein EG68_11261 [Paragonimus skrjabini miyazakii]
MFFAVAFRTILLDSQKLHICGEQEDVWEESNKAELVMFEGYAEDLLLVPCKSLCITRGWCIAVIHNLQTSNCKLYREGRQQITAERDEKVYLRKCLITTSSRQNVYHGFFYVHVVYTRKHHFVKC